MKKIVMGMAAVAMAASMFAVDISATVRGNMNVAANDGMKNTTDQVGADTFMNVAADGDFGGANADIRFKDGDDPRNLFADGWNVYVKPVDGLKFKYGTGAKAELFGEGDKYLDGKGLSIDFTMVEGLTVSAFVNTWNAPSEAKDTDLRAGATYAIDGVGTFGAEFYRNMHCADFGNYNAITAGASLSMIENTPIAITGTYYLLDDKDIKVNVLKAVASVNTSFDAISLGLKDCFLLATGDDADGFKPFNAIDFTAGYKFNDTVAANFEFKYFMNAAKDSFDGKAHESLTTLDDQNKIRLNVNVPLTFGSAEIKPEFNLEINGDDDPTWKIPLQFKYSF